MTSARGGTFIVRFWRGQCSLALSFWVVFVLLSLAFALLVTTINETLLVAATYDPRLILAAAASALAASALLTIWQCVGVWRAAARRRAESGGDLWPRLAQGAVALTALWFAGVTAAADVPALDEYGRMAFRDDPSVPPYHIAPSADGRAIAIAGGFKYGLTDAFLAMARAMPNLRTVQLESGGGRAGEARHLFEVIRARGLDTYVGGACFSACVLAYAGGRERWLGPGAQLGFHGPSFPGTLSVLPMRPDVATFVFKKAGFAPAFVARTATLTPDHLWKPTADALLAANVVTQIARADAPRGMTATQDRGSGPRSE